MSESKPYVSYNIVSQQPRHMPAARITTQQSASTTLEYTQPKDAQNIVEEFFTQYHPSGYVVEAYQEIFENKRTAKWPQLQKALASCQQHNATLLILELGTLTSNDSFTQILLKSGVHFHCIDQPFVNQNILEALSKHAEVQRKLHGKLIREGLKMTSAKSGNPNAAEVISRVNKPKIDTAIMFAFLLAPLVRDYRAKKYSQRQMVKTLNEEGFTAPEGGKWVLSQLQKVLDRVQLNEIALELEPTLQAFAPNTTAAQIAEALNEKKVTPLKQPDWNEAQVKKLQDRIEQIRDITLINQFVLDLLPVLHEYHAKNHSIEDILSALHHAQMPIRQPVVA